MLSTLLFSAFFNLPILEIGGDAIGFFDVLLLLIIVFFIKIIPQKFNPFFIFFSCFFVLITISSVINSINFGITFKDVLYLLKILELSLIPLVVTKILKTSKQYKSNLFYFDRVVFTLSMLLLFYSLYQIVFLGWYRSGVPFLYGSSGPLGLIGAGLVIYAYFARNYKYNILIIGISITLLAISKSFILGIIVVLIYKFRHYFNFRVVMFIITSLLLISLIGGFVTERVESLVYALQNFQDLNSLKYRISSHWFVLWNDHVNDYRLFIGGGVQSISLSFDSLYFYCFYTLGIFGSAILLMSGFILSVKYQIFRLYFIVALISGIFLEASLISYRGLEPLLIFLAYANFTYERRKYEG
jgi:hypothetical protein